MKKLNLLILSALTITSLTFGCGQNNAVITENTPDVSNTTTVEETPSEEPEEAEIVEEATATPGPTYDEDPLWADEHPAENTTRSYITNMWVTHEVEAIRPITVMFPSDQIAQPQYNIGEAGILYEIMAEGYISRMMGVIQGWHTLEKIGNIRSMRDYFVYVAKEWDPIVVHHGNIWYADDVLGTVDHIDGTSGDSSLAFFRVADKEAPHNSFVSGEGVLEYVNEFDIPLVHIDDYHAGHFIFTPVAHQNDLSDYSEALDASYIDMSNAFPTNSPYLEYNEEDGLYYRFMYGKEHMDAATGKQLTFKNIIVQNTYWEKKPDGTYLTFVMHDTTKDGWYFTNGKAIHITWEKSSDREATKYYDDNGAEIVLNTGKTMIFVVQEDKEIYFE